VSTRDLGLGVRLGLEFLGIRAGSVQSLLDNGPLAGTIQAQVSFGNLAENVRSGVIDAAAVAATSYETGRSVVFYDSPAGPARDDKRAIDYASTGLAAAHVHANAATEVRFPVVQVTDPVGMARLVWRPRHQLPQAPVVLARCEHDAMSTGGQLARLGVPAVTLPCWGTTHTWRARPWRSPSWTRADDRWRPGQHRGR
jgi:hypothetical protein